PPAAATPTTPPAPPPRSPPPSPHTPTHSTSSLSTAANPCRRRPAAHWRSWLDSGVAAQPLLAVEDPALDSPQRLELLAQRFLALVALFVRGLALSLQGRPLLVEAIDLPRDALTLGDLGRQECCVAAGGRPGGIDHRFEELRRARIVAQRRRQAGKERREA